MDGREKGGNPSRQYRCLVILVIGKEGRIEKGEEEPGRISVYDIRNMGKRNKRRGHFKRGEYVSLSENKYKTTEMEENKFTAVFLLTLDCFNRRVGLRIKY